MSETETRKLHLLAFGCGNMATPVLRGLKNGLEQLGYQLQWTFYTPSQTKAMELACEFEGVCLTDLSQIPKADIYVLGMKPQQFDSFSKEVQGKMHPEALVVSMLAGVNCQTISQKLNHSRLLRMMPNTPCHVGAGVIPLYFDCNDKLSYRENFKEALQTFAMVIDCDSEQMLDTLTPYCGSGPAYFYEFVRLLAQDLSARGVDEKLAQDVMIQTCLGAALMMDQSSQDPETLRKNVTSKGGVTAKALEEFGADSQWQKLVQQALSSALSRNQELSSL